jgi:hypothetical protein
MAFVGLQQNLMPHFLLFEAQARMAAGTFTGRNRSLLGVDIRRLPIASPLAEADDGSPTREEAEASAVQEPAAGNTGTALARFEDRLLQKHPELAALYSSDGVGLASGVYHDVLLEVSGVTGLTVGGASKEYAQELTGRWKSFLKGAAVKVFYKARSCAPLKRKEQHVLISNDV